MRVLFLALVLPATAAAWEPWPATPAQQSQDRFIPGREQVIPGRPEVRQRVDTIERERLVPVDRPVYIDRPVFVDRPVDRPFAEWPTTSWPTFPTWEPRGRGFESFRVGPFGGERFMRERGDGRFESFRVGPFGGERFFRERGDGRFESFRTGPLGGERFFRER